MQTRVRLIAVAASVGLLVAGCSEDSEPDAAGGASAAPTGGSDSREASLDQFDSRFNLIGMAHTAPRTARGLPIEVDTEPWDGTSTGGPYSFASAPCSADAPINNVSTNLVSFNTRLEGSRSPASTRLHPFEFEVLSLADGAGEMRGTIDLTVCQPRFGVTPPDGGPDTERERISIEFTADFTQPTAEETTYAGQFEITEGTGPYEGIRGSGEITGYFMCLGPERCAQLGGPRDAQVVMVGSYEAPGAAGQ